MATSDFRIPGILESLPDTPPLLVNLFMPPGEIGGLVVRALKETLADDIEKAGLPRPRIAILERPVSAATDGPERFWSFDAARNALERHTMVRATMAENDLVIDADPPLATAVGVALMNPGPDGKTLIKTCASIGYDLRAMNFILKTGNPFDDFVANLFEDMLNSHGFDPAVLHQDHKPVEDRLIAILVRTMVLRSPPRPSASSEQAAADGTAPGPAGG